MRFNKIVFHEINFPWAVDENQVKQLSSQVSCNFSTKERDPLNCLPLSTSAVVAQLIVAPY